MSDQLIAGIVCEYNPFHQGHAYHIAATRAAGATHIVCVMSGNFVQRGGPACCPKQVRARAAVACGADLVLELPLPYAMSTAERFAYGAISLLGMAGVDLLSFGSECGTTAPLQRAANAVDNPVCAQLTTKLMQSGISYAAARQQAVEQLCGHETANLLAAPNNTLAIEYLRQMHKNVPHIQPFTVKRTGAAHDSTTQSNGIASASALRTMLESKGLEALRPFVPAPAYALYEQAHADGLFPCDVHAFALPLLSTLRARPPESLAVLPDLSEGLEHRLYAAIRCANTPDDLQARVKSKRYPLARVRRLIWNAYLEVDGTLAHIRPPYLRILAANERGLSLLPTIVARAPVPVSHSLKRLDATGIHAGRFATLEARAGDLFALGLPQIQPCGLDYTFHFRPQ